MQSLTFNRRLTHLIIKTKISNKNCIHEGILSQSYKCYVHRRLASNAFHPITIISRDYHKTSINTKESKQMNIIEQMKSIPNIITMSRILCTPIVSYLIINEQYKTALASCVILGITDYVDGYIAKNYNMTTVLGTFLDPLADKIMINTLAITLCYNQVLPVSIAFIWLGRDVLLVGATYYYIYYSNKDSNSMTYTDFFDPGAVTLKVKPSFISKCNTVLQFGTLSAGILHPILLFDHNIVLGFSILSGGTTIASGLSYIGGKSLISSGNDLPFKK